MIYSIETFVNLNNCKQTQTNMLSSFKTHSLFTDLQTSILS